MNKMDAMRSNLILLILIFIISCQTPNSSIKNDNKSLSSLKSEKPLIVGDWCLKESDESNKELIDRTMFSFKVFPQEYEFWAIIPDNKNTSKATYSNCSSSSKQKLIDKGKYTHIKNSLTLESGISFQKNQFDIQLSTTTLVMKSISPNTILLKFNSMK